MPQPRGFFANLTSNELSLTSLFFGSQKFPLDEQRNTSIEEVKSLIKVIKDKKKQTPTKQIRRKMKTFVKMLPE